MTENHFWVSREFKLVLIRSCEFNDLICFSHYLLQSQWKPSQGCDQKQSEGAPVRPAVQEKKKRLRVSLCFNNRHTLGSYRGLNQSEIVKGGPQTCVYDAFLLFPNQKRDRAHVEEFQHAQHESPVYDRREN